MENRRINQSIGAMKQEISAAAATTGIMMSIKNIESKTTPPSRLTLLRGASSSKPKESPSPKPPAAASASPSVVVSTSTRAKSVPPQTPHRDYIPTTTNNNQKASAAASPIGSRKFREVKAAAMPNNRPPVVVVLEQFDPRQTTAAANANPNANANAKKTHEEDGLVPGTGTGSRRSNTTTTTTTNNNNKKKKKKEEELLEEKQLDLVKILQSEVSELKAELDKLQALNVELLSHNTRLTLDLASAHSKIAALSVSSTPHHQKESAVAVHQSPKFKDIQKLIANKLEHPKVNKEATREASHERTLLSLSPPPAQRKVTECPTTRPPPPPPPPLRRPPPPRSGRPTPKAPPVVQLYHSLSQHDTNKNPPVLGGNFNKPGVTNAHNSIVGEIQNRSAHLLAIKADIETKGDFINGLIQKVLAAPYTDIEDVLKFVHWLDNQLSSLSDERAVLKNFKWPERKADAMREAAIEFRGLKLLESEVSSFKDDSSIPCEVALKKMAALLDKSERSIQRLIKLRSTVMLSYQGYKIPTDWMLDSGIICKIKQASMILVNMYMKRIIMELESIRYSDRESTQEALLLQGVHFAYRAHQFVGGLDSETLCVFEEIRRRVPGHLRGCQDMLVGITSA